MVESKQTNNGTDSEGDDIIMVFQDPIHPSIREEMYQLNLTPYATMTKEQR
jgi:hypothetical protein